MLLRRLGNKSQLAEKIQRYFPAHTSYIDPFFGAGGMYFKKHPKAKYNFLNDKDRDVYNLFRVLVDQPDELAEWVELCPISQCQFDEWTAGKREATDVLNAVRFLFLSNFSLFGAVGTLKVVIGNRKKILLKNIGDTLKYMQDDNVTNCDFREVFKKIGFRSEEDKNNCFVYCDPPYLGTGNNYAHGFTEADSLDLFDVLAGTGMKWAMSEFDHPFILQQAEARGLFINIIGERNNIKNRKTEILVTNYVVAQQSLF